MGKSAPILGAEFSRGFDPESYPLLSDFLEVAERVGSYLPQKEHQQLASFIDRYFGSYRYNNIENIMSFLVSPPMDDRIIQLENRSFLYEQLLSIIGSTLGKASQNASGSGNRKIFEDFVDHLSKDNSIVISFNFDLLLERLLHSNGYWCGYDGYGVDIKPHDSAYPLPYQACIRSLQYRHFRHPWRSDGGNTENTGSSFQ